MKCYDAENIEEFLKLIPRFNTYLEPDPKGWWMPVPDFIDVIKRNNLSIHSSTPTTRNENDE